MLAYQTPSFPPSGPVAKIDPDAGKALKKLEEYRFVLPRFPSPEQINEREALQAAATKHLGADLAQAVNDTEPEIRSALSTKLQEVMDLLGQLETCSGLQKWFETRMYSPTTLICLEVSNVSTPHIGFKNTPVGARQAIQGTLTAINKAGA